MISGNHTLQEPTLEPWIWMAEDKNFPVFEIEMDNGHNTFRANLEELYKLMTTPAETGLDARFASQCPAFAPSQVGFELHFSSTKTAPECLGLVREMLDRVYTHPNRQFAVRTLRLDQEKSANTADMESVGEIIRRNHQLYETECVHLHSVLNMKPSAEEIKASGKLMAAAFNVNPEQQSALRRFSFRADTIGVQTVAAFCSALRYRCQVESLSVICTLNKLSKADRQTCWKWLAFGIFYPRSKKLAAGNKFSSLGLGQNHLEPGNIKAFKKKLLDPAGELVCQGDASHTHAKDELLLCTIKQDAKFYTTASVETEEIYYLDSDRVLEALC